MTMNRATPKAGRRIRHHSGVTLRLAKAFYCSRLNLNGLQCECKQGLLAKLRMAAMGHYQPLSIHPGEWLLSGP